MNNDEAVAILQKDSWTGEELGRLMIRDSALKYKNRNEKKDNDFIVGSKALKAMVATLRGKQKRIYENYEGIEVWITELQSHSGTFRQRINLDYTVLINYISDFSLAEDIYFYQAQLPVVMTSAQYKDLQEGKTNLSGVSAIRAEKNGIAVLVKEPEKREVDYKEPELNSSIESFSLESLLPEYEDSDHITAYIKRTTNDLKKCLSFLYGYNASLDLIAETYNIPEIAVYKYDLRHIESWLEAETLSVYHTLTQRVETNSYLDESLTDRKLEAMRRCFPVITPESLSPSKENLEKARELLQSPKAFISEDAPIALTLLLMIHKPDREEEEENG